MAIELDRLAEAELLDLFSLGLAVADNDKDHLADCHLISNQRARLLEGQGCELGALPRDAVVWQIEPAHHLERAAELAQRLEATGVALADQVPGGLQITLGEGLGVLADQVGKDLQRLQRRPADQNWVVVLGELSVERGETDDADATLSIKGQDLARILAGSLDPQLAVVQGKLRVSGDINKALAFGAILPQVIKEAQA